MTRRLFLALSLVVTACAPGRVATTPTTETNGAFRVGVIGDMPYHAPSAPNADSVMAAYRAVLDTLGKERLAFVVHVGDITGATCSDSLYAERAREFAALPHPLIYTFGDNEWTDCARDGRDPLERLTKLRSLFTQGDVSLGGRPMPLERQSANGSFAAYRENVRWTRGGVVFLTLHAIGSNNNWGREVTPSPEWTERNTANLAWLRDSFAQATRQNARGVAIFMQANMHLPSSAGPPSARQANDGFAPVVAEFVRLAREFEKPVALIHGDSHYFRVDQPFADARGRPYPNITRAETYGNPSFHGLLITVDPASPNLFRFEPLIVLRNSPR